MNYPGMVWKSRENAEFRGQDWVATSLHDQETHEVNFLVAQARRKQDRVPRPADPDYGRSFLDIFP
jgi:hypothetical protein